MTGLSEVNAIDMTHVEYLLDPPDTIWKGVLKMDHANVYLLLTKTGQERKYPWRWSAGSSGQAGNLPEPVEGFYG